MSINFGMSVWIDRSKKIEDEKLNEILDKHTKWIKKLDGGECANLSFVDLSEKDLESVSGGGSVMPCETDFFQEKLRIPVDYLNTFGAIAVADGVEAARAPGVTPVVLTGKAIRYALSDAVKGQAVYLAQPDDDPPGL